MILKKIKEQTQGNHTSLENSPFLRPISQKSLTLTQYITILKKFYGFFYPLELQLTRFPIETYLADFGQRRKAGMLADDLQHLQPHPASILPMCYDLPEVHTLEQAFGCLYVMEGSTLGGKMIYKMVNDTLGLDHTNGISFFYGYGAETGPKWKAFQQALEAVSSRAPAKDEQLIEAANNTFNKLKKWFESE
ncbi:biliverdin-producing heme oxygenase [Rhodocytophaga aerolata]|uniref:Biliverdin-producing heme oxygenase n=1 Tax=Rhodocytophaga aerolata TaxID=455078 RepID=A0ABT8R6J4_9BACT|nr:biliverdin-producing heme oxygenase [Rhodocytophaga aerolata]MDO1447725.1 biliverdin-producing heme oxygenase [Rhodocytophaga aerolata]